MEPRITHGRKRFLEVIAESPRTTFSELKESLILTKEMNLVTLYRIIDAFKEQGLIHELDMNGERIFFSCSCTDKDTENAVQISYCTKCEDIQDTHSVTDPSVSSSETVVKTKFCKNCQ